MNSYERVFTALNLGTPDRVPIFEGAIAPKVIEALIPGGSAEDLVEKYDLDVVYYREAYRYEPVDIQNNYFKDEWGIVMMLGDEVMPSPVENPIQKEEDLQDFSPLTPEPPIDWPNWSRRFAGLKGSNRSRSACPIPSLSPGSSAGCPIFSWISLPIPDSPNKLLVWLWNTIASWSELRLRSESISSVPTDDYAL